ncbi:hypothetical protein C478_18502 [Natrinema thermotolerans DSM 11552]|nr:hypothetical protein C478_18502 [Natrinema thermotolerans DSM 11552]
MDLSEYRSKLIGSKDERAVSPVIGVILMVAITVILAAVIAAFVLDLGQGQSANPQAGFDISETSSGDVQVSVTSIQNLDSIRFEGCSKASGDDETSPEVGHTYTMKSSCNAEDLTIVGTYDGNEVVMN